MTYVGIRELKVHLSRYVDAVRRGDEVVITRRGRAVARLVSDQRTGISLRGQLAPLAEEGLIVLPSHPVGREVSRPVTVSGTPVSEIVMEDRR